MGGNKNMDMRNGQLVLNGLMENPEGFLRVATKLLEDIPDGRLCAIKLTSKLEGHPKGSYAVCRLNADVEDGDLVLAGADKQDMRVVRLVKAEHGWTLQPVKRSALRPWFVSDLNVVMGKVEKIFDCED